MRIWMAMILAFWGACAQADEAGTELGIEAAIRGQIAAFLEDDFETAFGYADQGIRDIFGTADRFGLMVRRGYPMVHRPDQVRLLERRQIGGVIWQKVLIRDGKGVLHLLDYEMRPGADGWRIGAVHLLQDAGVGA